MFIFFFFFFQAEDGIRDYKVTGVQTCALPISSPIRRSPIWMAPTPCSAGWSRGSARSRRSGRASASGASTGDRRRVYLLRPQHFPLDPRIALSYIAACALLAGCPRPPAPLVPQPLAPADRDSAVAWTRATLPTHHTAIRFRWKYQDDQKRWGGRGQARIAPPDSLRFDYVGPLGLGAGAAAIVADSAIWADPEKNFRSLIPAVQMLWAALGIVRPPAQDAAVFGARGAGGAGGAGAAGAVRVTGVADSGATLWRFVQGAGTPDYRAAVGRAGGLEAGGREGGGGRGAGPPRVGGPREA